MILRWPLVVMFVLPASGCTIFSPYVPSAKIERELTKCPPAESTRTEEPSKDGKKITTKTTTYTCNTSTKELSIRLQERFQSNAASLSRTSNTTVLTIAGLLGVGAYKGITDGGRSQIAALGAGAGTLYGLHSAIYTPTREQLYQRAVKSLICLDVLYADIDPGTGEALAKKYTNHSNWYRYKARYESAYELSVTHENSYRGRVKQVPAELNILLSNSQPSPAESHAKINSAITTKIEEISAPSGLKNLASFNAEKEFPDLVRWVDRTKIASDRINTSNPDSCNLTDTPVLRVLGVANQGTITLKVDETRTLPITNNSSVISSNIYPTGTDADKNAVSSVLISENGAFAIKLEAHRKPSKPVVVKLTDTGNGNVSTVFFVDVNQP